MQSDILDFSKLWIQTGALCGIIGFIVFIVSAGSAITMIPGYNLLENWFSELGVSGVAGIIFNSGLMLSGLFFVFFFLGLNIYLKQYLKKEHSLLVRAGIVLGAASSISLIFVGIFPTIYPFAHKIPTVMFFGFAGFCILFISVYLFSIQCERLLVLVGAGVFVVDVLFALYSNAFVQKFAVFFIGLWYFIAALKMYKYSR